MGIKDLVKGVMAQTNLGWPIGADGDLTIASGNVDLAAGSIKDYRNVYIETGATLTITVNSHDFTILGCKYDFTLKGSIIARTNTTIGAHSQTALDGVALSSTITQNTGGHGACADYGERRGDGSTDGYGGGGSGNAATADLGGPGGNGGGGGGAGGTYALRGGDGDIGGGSGCASVINDGNNASGTTGGTSAGSGSGYGADAYGQNGASDNRGGGGSRGNWGQNGGNGGNGITASYGGGGGGGGQGYHGKNLYIRCRGIFNGTGGVINVSGLNGGSGGNGGSSGGGGGGGGAGGSGGKIYIRHGASVGAYTAATYTVTGGTGGSAGTGTGTAFAGANGNAGSTDIAAI